MIVGPRRELDRIRSHLAQMFEFKSKVLGPGRDEEQEVNFLGMGDQVAVGRD